MDRLKPQEVNRRLKAARNHGNLDPIFRWIEDEVAKREKPDEPQGPEWPYKRAYSDGFVDGLSRLYRWIVARSEASADAPSNTED